MNADLVALLDGYCSGAADMPFDYGTVPWRRALPVVADYLKRPMKMDRIERIEAVFKRYLHVAFRDNLTGNDARFIAETTRKVGFILKFKPYGVKCATPLGYSIFFLRPGMGFSFQRHLTRKTELFHMLQILERGQVYLSTSEEWQAVYDKDAFNRWLAGAPDARYAKFSVKPNPGDVYLVTELETVHSVLGCVIEEYATVSTDMVDRLHDQNTGRDDVDFVDVATVEKWLAALPRPLPTSCWKTLSAPPVPMARTSRDGVQQIVLADTGEFLAERFEIDAGRVLRIDADPARARSIFCLGGRCRFGWQPDAGAGRAADVELAAGEVIIVPPRMRQAIVAEERVSLSSHTIRPELALV